MKRVPFNGRHIDPQLLPSGLRRIYVLFWTWWYHLLMGHISSQAKKCMMSDPLHIFGRGAKRADVATATSAAPLGGLKGEVSKTDAEKIMELREKGGSSRRSYEEGRQNHDTMPQIRSSAPEKADDGISALFASQLVNDRSGRYGRGRGRFLVLEDDVFSPTDAPQQEVHHGSQ